MLKTTFITRLVVALSTTLTFVACADDEENAPNVTADTGAVADAAGGADSTSPDVDEPTDVGAADAAVEPDVSVEPDAAVLPDATAEPDAAVEPDVTVEPDATAEPDTTAQPDATNEPDATDTDIDEPCDTVATAIEAFAAIDSVSAGTVSATTADGVTVAEIDASAGGSAGAATNPWIYINLADAEQVSITDVESFTSADWDLGFKRASIRLNSGDSGPGAWLATRADDLPWAAALRPPGRDADWRTDEFVAEDCSLTTEGRGTPATAFGIWYDYNPETHSVSPTEDVVYFLYRSDTRAVYRLQITGWSSGLYNIQWATL
jgi:hypothetical protein